MTQKAIGPSFPWELAQAGVNGGAYSWTADGTITFQSGCSASMQMAVAAVYAAHDPSKVDPFAIQSSAQAALDRSDITMHRIVEAVTDGANAWTNPDVVAWVAYRRALRAIVKAPMSVQAVPAVPAYPAGT